MILAWSIQEAGKYLETFKAFENKSPDQIMGRIEPEYMPRLVNTLSQVRSVNKTDALTLASNVGSFRKMANSSLKELALLPGFGDQKASRLFEAFNENFIVSKETDNSAI
ncbi:DNA excision repair protein ERCC-1 [Smittium mucronatum]|uniref:DNA excision repair protein ERCC-1 n=1 Tax=Smittium mucronatum TaxID=133383 RepID=A0A1R0GV36_9FUNG|nr:DNA excision repair protein ERCC-1 [Smittium mucronatum]